jgi:hypothetical protein
LLLKKVIKKCEAEKIIGLFWNEKILTEQFYIFEKGKFKKDSKYKTVDIVLGKPENKLIHPLVIVNCRVWTDTTRLNEDLFIFERIRNIYPTVIGYSLSMYAEVPWVSLICCSRTGLKVFGLSKQFEKFINDIKEFINEIKKELKKK